MTRSLLKLSRRFTSATFKVSNTNTKYLTTTQLNFLDENGYLHVPNFLSATSTNKIKTEILNLLDNFDVNESKSVFKAHRSDEQYKKKQSLILG